LQLKYETGRLTAALSGEIDHHSAAALRDRLDEAILKLRPERLRLDFDEVSFMDSSAVGLVMGRYRSVSDCGGALEVVNLSPAALRMMRMSGLQSLASLRQKTEADETAQGGNRQ
jgi:stage II sporulation protein AA (anti-sigma F factor antagonist)